MNCYCSAIVPVNTSVDELLVDGPSASVPVRLLSTLNPSVDAPIMPSDAPGAKTELDCAADPEPAIRLDTDGDEKLENDRAESFVALALPPLLPAVT